MKFKKYLLHFHESFAAHISRNKKGFLIQGIFLFQCRPIAFQKKMVQVSFEKK